MPRYRITLEIETDAIIPDNTSTTAEEAEKFFLEHLSPLDECDVKPIYVKMQKVEGI